MNSEEHLQNIVDILVPKLKEKYRAGAKEHKESLLDKEDLLDEALDEAIDLMVYLVTEKQRRDKIE